MSVRRLIGQALRIKKSNSAPPHRHPGAWGIEEKGGDLVVAIL